MGRSVLPRRAYSFWATVARLPEVSVVPTSGGLVLEHKISVQVVTSLHGSHVVGEGTCTDRAFVPRSLGQVHNGRTQYFYFEQIRCRMARCCSASACKPALTTRPSDLRYWQKVTTSEAQIERGL